MRIFAEIAYWALTAPVWLFVLFHLMTAAPNVERCIGYCDDNGKFVFIGY